MTRLLDAKAVKGRDEEEVDEEVGEEGSSESNDVAPEGGGEEGDKQIDEGDVEHLSFTEEGSKGGGCGDEGEGGQDSSGRRSAEPGWRGGHRDVHWRTVPRSHADMVGPGMREGNGSRVASGRIRTVSVRQARRGGSTMG